MYPYSSFISLVNKESVNVELSVDERNAAQQKCTKAGKAHGGDL